MGCSAALAPPQAEPRSSPRPPPALTEVFLARLPRDFTFLPRCRKEGFHFQAENKVRDLRPPSLLSLPVGDVRREEGGGWGRVGWGEAGRE